MDTLNLKSITNPGGIEVEDAEITFHSHGDFRQPLMHQFISSRQDFYVTCFEHKNIGDMSEGIRQSDGSVKIKLSEIFNEAELQERRFSCITRNDTGYVTDSDDVHYHRISFDSKIVASGGNFYYVVRPAGRATFAFREKCKAVNPAPSGRLLESCKNNIFGIRPKGEYLSVIKGEIAEQLKTAALARTDYSSKFTVYLEDIPEGVYD